MKENVEQHLDNLKKQLEEQKNNLMITQGAILFAERLLKEAEEVEDGAEDKISIHNLGESGDDEYLFAETIEKTAEGSEFNYIGRNKDNEIVFKILGSNLDIAIEEA